jgi:hypothetical protein
MWARDIAVVMGVVALAGVAYSDGGPRDSGAAPPGAPRTLVRVSTPGVSDVGPIYGFAQDGDVLAWADNGAGPATVTCPPIRMRVLSSRRTGIIGQAGGKELCDEYGFWIAAGGTRALWGGWEPANHPLGEVVVGGLGRRPRRVEGLASDYGEVGDDVVDIVGDGQTLVYATLVVEPNDLDACFPEYTAREKTCRFRVSGGAVKRMVGNEAVLIPRVPPAAAVAVSAGRLADVPADRRWGYARRARANGPVEIRHVRTGRLVLGVRPHGEVEAVALSGAVLAGVVRQGPAQRLDVYGASTGKLRSSVVVEAGARPELAAAGTTVVYLDKTQIRMLRAGEQATSLVARAGSGYPFDLSIEGTRVAWAENRNGRLGLIRAIDIH